MISVPALLDEIEKIAESRRQRAERIVDGMSRGDRRRAYLYLKKGVVMSPLQKGRGLEEGGSEAVVRVKRLQEKVRNRSRKADIIGALGGAALGGGLVGASAVPGRRLVGGLMGAALGGLVGGFGGYAYGKNRAVNNAMAPIQNAPDVVRSHLGNRLRRM